MRIVAIILIIVGVVGVAMGSIMFGDIGIACIVGGLSALLSGIGFMIVSGKLKKTGE